MAETEYTTRDQLDWLFDLFRRATRYWMVAGAIFILGGALSLTLALGTKPQYESEVVLLYQEMISQSVLQGRDVVKSSRGLASRYKEMVFSRTQLTKVVEAFDLFPGTVKNEGMVSATETIRQRIVFRDKGSGTFRIIYRGDTREEARDVADMLAKLLIEQDNRVRQIQAKTTKEFLVAEKNDAEEALKATELEFAEFLAEHPEFAEETATATAGAAVRVNQGAKKPVVTSSPGNPELALLLRQRNRVKARLDNPDDSAPIAPILPRKPAPKTQERRDAERVVASAERQVNEARIKLADSQRSFTDAHPDVRAARAKLAAATRDLAAKQAALPPLDNGTGPDPIATPGKPIDREALGRELTRLDAAVAAARRRRPSGPATTPVRRSSLATDLVEIETRWTSLMRNTSQNRERVERLESRVFTANITASSEFANASQLAVIDEAFLPPAPAGRSRKIVAFAGIFFFALLALGLGLGLALVDDRIFRRIQLSSSMPPGATDIPVMAVVPDASPRWWKSLLQRGSNKSG